MNGPSQSTNCSGSIAMYPMPAISASKKIHSSGRPPPDFFPGFIGEMGLVAVV
jgi:hypothetical protein